jgi:1-deoxyxylulose-5-phosphate synthase
MLYKNLGRTGLKVSTLALGGLAWGAKLDEAESIPLIKRAISEGINFIDTADLYGKVDFSAPRRGQSEEIVGKAIKGERHSVVLATKVCARVGTGINDIGLNRKHIMEGIENSLRILQTDYIDLYYAHAFDYTTPLEETLRAMDDLVHQGKVRYIGCSNFRAWQLCKSLWLSDRHNLSRFDCIQSAYNLLARDVEDELLPLCIDEGVGVAVWSPLGGGLLTGKYDKNDPNQPPPQGRGGYKNLWQAANFEAIKILKKAAEENGHSVTQLAIAWLLNNAAITSVVCGVTSDTQLKENLSAIEVKLSTNEIAACDAVWKMLSPQPKMPGPSVSESERIVIHP